MSYDWAHTSKQLLAGATALNFITLVTTSTGLFYVKKWIKESFEGERRWRCSKDGNFLVYLILVVILTAIQLAVIIYVSQSGRFAFDKR